MIIIIITIREGEKCPRCGSKQEGRNLILQCCKAEPPTVEKAQCQPLIKCVTLNRWLFFFFFWSMRSSVSSLVKQSPWVFPALTFWLQDHVCRGPDCEGHGCRVRDQGGNYQRQRGRRSERGWLWAAPQPGSSECGGWRCWDRPAQGKPPTWDVLLGTSPVTISESVTVCLNLWTFFWS